MTKLVKLITARQEEEARLRSLLPPDQQPPLLDQFGRPLPPQLPQGGLPLDPANLTFVRATFAYDKTDEGELSLRPDDIVAVLTPKSERSEPGWWKGRLRDGTVGWFPSTHVAELPMKKVKTVE